MIDRYSLSTYSDMKREIFFKNKEYKSKCTHTLQRDKKSSNIEKEKNIFMKYRMQEKKIDEDKRETLLLMHQKTEKKYHSK